MTVATIKYDLSDSDDRTDFNRAMRALDMAGCLWDLQDLMREGYDGKFNDPYDINGDLCDKEAVAKAEVLPHIYHFNFERFNERFWEVLKDRNINLDELYN